MIEYASLSDKGDQKQNEDCIVVEKKGTDMFFAVADGLGGHNRGGVASRTAAETAAGTFKSISVKSEEELKILFEAAQDRLLRMQECDEGCRGMMSTMNILCIAGKNIFSGHIGDTRTYYFLDGKIVSRTLDHSVPQVLAAAGEIRESEIRGHADRNRLLRAMGAQWEHPEYTIGERLSVEEDQAFLMCTDGFWEYVLERQMTAALKKSRTPEEWLRLMEKIVLEKGSGKNMDNYSAVGVWIRHKTHRKSLFRH